MSEFIPITTQEDFDARIKERLERQAKKISDYDTIKKSNADLQKQLDDLTRSNKEMADKYAKYDKEKADYIAKIKGYETDSIKNRFAREYNIPYEAIGYIQGQDEDAIKASAEGLSKIIGNGSKMRTRAPLASTEPSDDKGGSNKRDALRAMVKTLEGE